MVTLCNFQLLASTADIESARPSRPSLSFRERRTVAPSHTDRARRTGPTSPTPPSGPDLTLRPAQSPLRKYAGPKNPFQLFVYGFDGGTADARQTIGERTKGEKSGTRIGMVDETARRRLIVEDLMKAGLSVRMISDVTDIPRSSVHRAMRAIARAEAKKEVVIAEIASELLGERLPHRRRGRR